MTFDVALALRLAREAGYTLEGAIHHEELARSTQDLAKRAAIEGAPQGTTFVADEQSHGRGRQGRVWVAPRGSALLLSVLLRPLISAASLPPLALVIGLAIHDALLINVSADVLRIKWPNDVLIQGRKVAGVLVEASLRGDRPESVIVGIGLNLLHTALPPEIEAHATSLQQHGVSLSREAALGRILAAMEHRIFQYVEGGLAPLLAPLRAADGTRGRRVRWQGQEATAYGIGEDGRLWLDTAQGRVAVATGEVQFF